MAKKNTGNAFSQAMKIFIEGVKLYFLNFEKFFKYMSFPILGQVIGLALIFSASFVFTLHVSTLTTKSPIFDNIPVVFLLLGLLTLPGFFIFCKAFWEYLIAMASLNSMASTILEGGKLDDLGVHAELIKRRSLSYVFFLLILSIIFSFLVVPLFIFIGIAPVLASHSVILSVIFAIMAFPLFLILLSIVFVYVSLAYQVFALEEDRSATDAIFTAINYIKGNFWTTSILLILLGITTYWLVPGLISWGFETGNLAGFFSYPVEQYIKLLPLDDINDMIALANIPYELKSYTISKTIVSSVVSIIVTTYALPLRSLCCTILYKDINNRNYAGKIAAEKLAQRAQRNESGKNKSKKRNSGDDDE